MKQLEPKPLFKERISKLLGDVEDEKEFWRIIRTGTPASIRCNTLKISCEELRKRLEEKGWKIKQPFSEFPEVMIVENRLEAGELGKTREHLLGYYYVQEISSMLPLLALKPKPEDIFLDLCASPGSKTTQAGAMMNNKGIFIANDSDFKRIKILSANLERCGVMNAIVTRKDGVQLCETLERKTNLRFDKILVDVPCSGEGTLRKSPKTLLRWNLKVIQKLSRIQKKLALSALKILKPGGEMIYSTCTLSPEENEEVIDFLKKNFEIEIEKIELPVKTRCGICEFEGKKFHADVKNACRLWPQDNNTDGFFLCKVRKVR